MATACITGASSGIGMEFAKQLAAKGYNLILIARNTKALETLAQKLPCKCKIIFCDLSKEAQCIQLAERLKKYNIHILINNAGFGDLSSFHSADLGKSLDMINVNIKALHIFTRKLLPVFIKKKPRLYIKCSFKRRPASRRSVYVLLLCHESLCNKPYLRYISGIKGFKQQSTHKYALSRPC